MRIAVFLGAFAAACGGPVDRPLPPTPRATTVPIAPDAAARVDRATKLWLAGDLDAARTELAAAGGDPRALELSARLGALTGEHDAARRAAAALLARERSRAPEAHVIGDVTHVDNVVLSPDGAYVATFERAEHYEQLPAITVWSTLDGSRVFQTRGNRAAFGPVDGEMRLVVLVGDPGEVTCFDAATGTKRWTKDGLERLYTLAIDRRGTLTLVTTYRSTLIQMRMSDGKQLRTFENEANASVVSLAADGRSILAANYYYDLEPEQPTTIVQLPPANYASNIEDMTVAPDGSTIAISHKDGSVTLADHDGKQRIILASAGPQAQLLDDGTLVATDGKHVTHWNVTMATSLGELDIPADIKPFDRDRFVIGAGGQAIGRRGNQLVVLQLASNRAQPIAELGDSTRASSLAWSHDGTRLGIITASTDLFEWTVAGGLAKISAAQTITGVGYDDQDKLEINGKPTRRFSIAGKRAFVRDDTGAPLRFVESTENLTVGAIGTERLVTAGVSGELYVWDATTAEGLGSIATRGTVSALALTRDDRTLAVALHSGGIELWNLAARTRIGTLVTTRDGYAFATPDGRVEGDSSALVWRTNSSLLPSAIVATARERHLAATVLARELPAKTFARTPPPSLSPRGCLPQTYGMAVVSAELAGNRFTYCLTDRRSDPYCYTFDLATRKTQPEVAPLAAVAPAIEVKAPELGAAKIDKVDDGVKVCTPGEQCRVVPAPDADYLAISDDGKIAATGDEDHVETWDVTTGKRIARFHVDYGEVDEGLQFWSHDVLAGKRNIYTKRGKRLGTLGMAASDMTSTRFHDDVWVLSNQNEGLAIRDARSGVTLATHDHVGFDFAASPDRVAVVDGGNRAGRVVVFGRVGGVVAKGKTPGCGGY